MKGDTVLRQTEFYLRMIWAMLRGRTFRYTSQLKSYAWISKSRNLRCPCTARFDEVGRMIYPGEIKFKVCGCGLYEKAMKTRRDDR
jgi:hypothetical protein